MLEERTIRGDMKSLIDNQDKYFKCNEICISCDAYPSCPKLKQEPTCKNCFDCEEYSSCPARIL
jgi:hypothetical protein